MFKLKPYPLRCYHLYQVQHWTRFLHLFILLILIQHVTVVLHCLIKLNIHYECKSRILLIIFSFYWIVFEYIEMVYTIIKLNGLKFLQVIIYGNEHQKIIVKVMRQISIWIIILVNLDNKTILNYTTQFLGVQYFVDLSIIQYVTSIIPSISSVSSIYFFVCFIWNNSI